MIKIAKFGGSSVASVEQFKKVKAIVEADPDRRFIVSSASGKRFSGDNKITDLLLLVNAHIEYHVDCTSLLADIEARFQEIADGLGLSWPVAEKFEEFALRIKKYSPEFVVSRGEWFTCNLLAEYLDMPFIDAADVIVFHHDGTVDMERTASRLRDAVAREGSFVLPGFYGATVDGAIKLFQRGGGDITGAIVARCLDAGLYENWTDVSGILMADPGIVRNPVTVPVMTYKELRELSYLGATVMHPDVVEPVVKLGIPIIIKNTMNPDATGTLVVKDKKYYKESMEIAGISGKRGFVVIKLEKTGLNDDTKLRQSILDFFTENSVNITNIIAGIDSLILLVPKDNFEKTNLSFFEMEANIRKMAGGIKIDITKDIAVIGVVGRELGSSPTVVIKTLSALAGRRIDVKLIDHGQGQISILIAVAATDYAEAIRSIYGRFV